MSQYIFSPSPSFGVGEHSFVTWQNAFTDEELNSLEDFCENYSKTKASVGGYSKEDDISEIRSSKISWIDYNQESSWIYDRLAYVARQLNGQFYDFDLSGFDEHFQYTIYDGSENGHYTWHIDSGTHCAPRKFTMVLQLSNSENYEGGYLEILISANPIQITKERGLIAAFPSYTLHRVTPVTSGIRKTLVIWVCGPKFK